MELNPAVRLFLYLMIHVVSSRDNKDWSTHHLDAALQHYDTLHVDNINHTSPADAHHVVRFSALGKDFHLVLEWDRELLTKDFTVHAVDAEGRHHLHPIQRKAFLHGHLKSRESDSTVTAHLSDDGILSAMIATPIDTYHVEPSQHYISQPHPFHMVVYAHSHVRHRLNSTLFDYATHPVLQPSFSKHHAHSRGKGAEPVRRLRRQTLNTGNIRGMSCNMILIADTSAYRMFGSSVSSTSSQLVLLVSSLDKAIYRPSRWFIDVDDNSVTGLGHSIQQIIVRTEPSDNPMDYNFDQPGLGAGDVLGLMRFGEWSEFCLAHLFTDREFPGGLLGLANIASPSSDQTGGICSQDFRDFSFTPPRTIIFNTGLSTYNNAGQRMVLSEMMRVTGHELGHNWGSHHDPDTNECSGFIMNEFAQDGSEDSHVMFSGCSSRSVGNVLLSKAGCFIDPLCGDYTVDEGEACDAGTDGDNCCTSQCTLTEGSTCSDVNSPCCMNCIVAAPSVECRAPIGINCVNRTFCDGENFNCPLESPPVLEDTPCPGGMCQTQGSATRPECVPLCESMDLIECECDLAEECLVCCRNSTASPCTSLEIPLANGSVCQRGVCINGKCTDKVQDTIERFWDIITNLDTSAFLEFVVENIVGWTLIFSIPLWCLGSCLLHWLVDHPRQKVFERSVDNMDMGKLFVRRHRQSHRVAPLEKQELLSGSESPVEPVDEPVDDLPPPR